MTTGEFLLNKFYCQFFGPPDGRKWVFLHGLMGFCSNWRKVIHYLEDSEHVLTFDQRGHGRSIKPNSGYMAEDYAADLLDILDFLKWEKIILVGHSMGGRNALNFCNTHPDRVEKFVLEDIGPNSKAGNYRYFENLLAAVPTPFPSRESAKVFFQSEFKQRFQTRDRIEMVAAYLNANIVEKNPGEWDWRFSKSAVLESAKNAESIDRWQEIDSLSVPTLLVRGKNSPELSLEDFQRMLSRNSLIQGVEIEDAGHWVHADKPAEFAKIIRNFVGF